jgi:hypothetical protein
MSVHKEIVFRTDIVKRISFNVTQERERIKACAQTDILDGVDYALPEWVIEKMTAMCDAIEAGDIDEVDKIHHANLYDAPRHNDTVVAEYFPMIVDELLSVRYDPDVGSDFVIENIQEVMD